MPKYCIHTYPKREWYVRDFIIPSMLKQGIAESDISVYNDIKGEGNLVSCMKAFLGCEGDGGTWHLQDDILISRKFKEKTEELDDFGDGLICGFNCEYDGTIGGGFTSVVKHWWSFPCIRIPNEIARGCGQWYFDEMRGNPVYRHIIGTGKCDDWLFYQYLHDYYRNLQMYNVVPNLVEHVDYLLGGSSLSPNRTISARSLWLDEEDKPLVDELEKTLRELGKIS